MLKRFFGLAGIFFAILFACAPQKPTVKPERVKPEVYYQRGLTHLTNDSLKAAARNFHASIKADSNFADGYAGLAFLLAKRGAFDKAYSYADKALNKRPSADSHYFMGRILLMDEQTEQLDQAISHFDKSIFMDSTQVQTLYYKGIALKKEYQFKQAFDALQKCSDKSEECAKKAKDEIAFLKKVLSANPRTQIGRRLVLKDALTRADVAALLVQELNVMELLRHTRPLNNSTAKKQESDNIPKITDISDHWARSFITNLVSEHIMNVYPDNTFRPEHKVKRHDFAVILQNVYVKITGKQDVTTRYIDTPSTFPDVQRSHYAYNAIQLFVHLDVMSVDQMTGEFEGSRVIKGVEALSSIHTLRNILE